MEKQHFDWGYGQDISSHRKSSLPTRFCVDIAKECGLLEPTERMDDYHEQMERLDRFQGHSIFGDFEEALNIFADRELTEEQKEQLELIYELTPGWIKGYIFNVLVDRMNAGSAKDTAESAKLCLSILLE